MSIYRGTGGASSTTSSANVEAVLEASVQATNAAAAASNSASNAASSASGASTSASNASTSESNAATSESNAATSETNAATSASSAASSATASATSAAESAAQVVLAQAEVSNAATEVTYAEEWANKAEDSLVSVAAGGNGVDEYSAKHWAAKAADIVADGVIDDAVTSSALTWSSTKIAEEIGTSQTATLSLTTGQTQNITQTAPVSNPVLAVQKENPQLAITTNQFSLEGSGTLFDYQDYAYAANITFSATTGSEETVTLSTGSWSSDDVGRTIIDGTGRAYITAQDGTAVATVSIIDEVAASTTSGNWQLNDVVFDGTTAAISNGNVIDIGGLAELGDLRKPTNYNIADAVYSGDSFSVASQDTVPRAITFNTDGTKMYMVGTSSDRVYQYTLSTPFKVSTASYDSVSFSIGSQDSTPWDVAFNNDGTKMYVLGATNNSVFQYTLSTAFDLSTASYDSVSFSVNAQDTNPRAVVFNTDGTKMYMVGDTTGSIYQYTLSTPYSVSTASYDSVSFSVAAQDTLPESMAFNHDGSQLFVYGGATEFTYEYYLSTPFDISTTVYSGNSFNSDAQDTDPTGIAFNNDGSKMYIVGTTNDTIYEYNLPAAVASYKGQSFSVASEDGAPYDVAFNTDGSKMYVVGTVNDSVYQYTLSTPYSVSTASYDSVSFSVNAQDTGPRSVAFNNDGSKMYVAGNTTDSIYQYTLSTGFDLSTASYDSVSFSVNSQDTSPSGFAFNNDGSKMYVVGSTNKTVFQYTLSTPFDLSTASYDSVSFSVNAQDTGPYGIAFNNDGTKMYYLGTTNKSVFQYTLSTAFDLSTSSYDSVSFSVTTQDTQPLGLAFNDDGSKMYMAGTTNQTIYEYDWNIIDNFSTVSFSVAGQDTSPWDVVFNTDGTKMYVLGGANDSVYQYTLTTAFELSTASYDSVSFSVTSQDTNPFGVAFNTDGSKMYMLGFTNKSVYQYTLSTPFSVSTASYDSVSFSVTSQDTSPAGLTFNNDGSKMYMVGQLNDSVFQYTLSTPFDLSTASYDSVSFSVAGQDTSPWDVVFNNDGSKMYVSGNTNDSVYQYTLTTGFDLSTASYDSVSFSVASQDSTTRGIAFNNDYSKMYMVGQLNDSVYQYTFPSTIVLNTLQNTLAVIKSNSTAQINTSLWVDINSKTITDSDGGEEIYYAFSTDDKVTYVVLDATGVQRSIARLEAGVWEYNSNATYASETWTSATTNDSYTAIKEALAVAANQMTSTTVNALTDAQCLALGDTLDMAIAFRTATTATPSFTNINYDYDSLSKWTTAVPGTDYNINQLGDDATLEFTTLVDANYKVRIK